MSIPFKIGICANCGGKNRKLIGKLCFEPPIWCYQERQKAKYKAKQEGKVKKVTPIKKVSDKQAKLNTSYSVLRKQYMKYHPYCEYEDCTRRAEDIHHKSGRGQKFLDTDTWMSVCRQHHEQIHTNDKESRKKGYLQSKLS